MTPYHFFYVYILRSIKNIDSIYIGYTRNLRKRLSEHNSGDVMSTKRYVPWKLMYYEAFPEDKLAREREMQLKHNGNSMRELKKRIGYKKSDKGFTLIETIIYIALFSVLITGGFIACYQIISSNDSLNQKVRTEAEGNFVMRKFAWSLSGLDSASLPTISGTGCNQSISIQKTNTANPVRIRQSTVSGITYIDLQDDGVNYYPITTSNAKVSCLKFSILSGTPYGVIGTTTINGKDFVIRKYARI